MNKRGRLNNVAIYQFNSLTIKLAYCYIVPSVHLTSLNSITRSRFIGYNLSLLQHPFISAAKLRKINDMLGIGFWGEEFFGLNGF